MHLDHFTVSIGGTLLIERALGRSGADDGIGGLAEDGAYSAGGHDDGVAGEGYNVHRAQIHGADAAADILRIEHGGEELPVLVLLYLAFGFEADRKSTRLNSSHVA